MTSDSRRELALAALREITPETSIGEFVDEQPVADGVTVLTFETKLAGYPNWSWNVALAEVDGDAATVLEAELLPNDGALIAPEWVPWSVRLTEYLEAQRLAAEAGEAEDDIEVVSDDAVLADDGDGDDEDDDDDDDTDEDGDDDGEDGEDDDTDEDDDDSDDSEDIEENDLVMDDFEDLLNEEDLDSEDLPLEKSDEADQEDERDD